jgi:PAS domain S-box-containing protein
VELINTGTYNLYSFLKGGGEMGERTRTFDWSKTPLGTPDNWPQSLRTSVSILLNSQFPMFVWWGEELTTIYNDSYKVIAGDKHPNLLGHSGKEAWSEIWEDLAPLVASVFNGNSTWSEDLLLNIKRRGFAEQTYFTFSYSPILNEVGNVGGLFCAVVETTEKVVSKRKLEQSEQSLRNVILQAPFATCIFRGEEFVIEIANSSMLELWGRTWEDLADKPLFEAIPDAKDQGYEELMTAVFKTGKDFSAKEQPVTLLKNGIAQQMFINFTYRAIREVDGTVSGIMAVAVNVTEQVIARKKIEESESKLRNVILRSPAAICIVRGPQYIIEIANDKMYELWGRTEQDVLHKPVFEAMPEVANQGFEDILNTVYTTGQTFTAYGAPLSIQRNGNTETVFVNVAYEPFREDNGTVSGIMAVSTDVTEQVLTSKRIEESENRFRVMVEQAPMPIGLTVEREMIFESINEPMLQLIDRSENVLQRRVQDVLPELKEQLIEDILHKVWDTGEPYTGYETPVILRINGKLEQRYYNISYTPVFEEGVIKKIIHFAFDVTEQLNSRKRVEDSEFLFRSLIEKAPVANAFYTGQEITIQYANDIMLGYWGKDQLVIGKTFREAIPELEGQHFFDSLQKVFTTGEPYIGNRERADLSPDGTPQTFYFNFTYKALRNKNGEIYGIHHTAIDVTQEVLVQKHLEESEKNLRSIILTAPVAMTIFKGASFTVELANDRMFELWGRPAEQILGRPVFDALPEAKGFGFEELLGQVYSTGETRSVNEYPLQLLRNGVTESVYVTVVYAPFRDGTGAISGIIGVAVDVTAQVIARRGIESVVAERTRELADANKQLQQTNNELKQFAYVASHDLQEPIRKVLTFSQMLEKHLGKVDDRSQNYLHKISASSVRMLSLIRDVLTFSQLSQEREKFTQVDLMEVLQNIMSDFELVIEEKHAQIKCSSLPIIVAIPLQMNQLFSNLVSNALKFSKKGVAPVINITSGVLPQKELHQHPELNQSIKYYKIQFSDNGIGFEQENADKIFDIFQRLHGKQDYEGTGIGLALCKKIALNHDGNLTATSSLNNGATFNIFLPKEVEVV